MTLFKDLARERAERGAALLDKDLGPGWEARVDLDAISMYSMRRCVLGQLYGTATSWVTGYTAGVDALGIDEKSELQGFNIEHDADLGGYEDLAELDNPMDAAADALADAWRDLITERTAQ